MRVIAGVYRSRVLAAPRGMSTRPTSDRLRETLFNVLAPRIEGARFLDLYAGSGAVGIEALSRGAAEVVFVERAAPALRVLRANLEKLAVHERVRVQASSVAAFLRAPLAVFDLVFLDPPYDAAQEYEAALALLGALPLPASSAAAAGAPRPPLLAEGAQVAAEHSRKHRLQQRYGALARTRLLEQGDAALSFYSVMDDCSVMA